MIKTRQIRSGQTSASKATTAASDPCRVTLFGTPHLVTARQHLVALPDKAFALVAMLVIRSSGLPETRRLIRQLLWSESAPSAASANLRSMLMRIQLREIEDGFSLLDANWNSVALARTADLDLVRFFDAARGDTLEDFITLCDLYRGELLDGMDFDGGLNDWLQTERNRIRQQFSKAGTALIEDRSIDRRASLMVAQRVIEVDPYHEPAHRALMQGYADSGEQVRVRETYLALKNRLASDLNVDPQPETTDLYFYLLPRPATAAHREVERSIGRAEESRSDSPLLQNSGAGVPKFALLPPLQLGLRDPPHHWAVALVEDVTIGLCRLRSLSVIAPYTASQLNAGGDTSSGDLGIDYVAETRLQDVSGEHRFSIRLLNARTREILWTQLYAFDHSARFLCDLSVRIVLSLAERIERAELARFRSEQDETAYHLYLVGQKTLQELDLPNVRRARKSFKEAIAACPTFVPALSGLARTYQREWMLMARGDGDLLTEAERLARQAIEIDPDDARGYRELGISTLFKGGFDEALAALAQAEELNPQHADLLVDHADALSHKGDTSPALEKVAHAIELNPLCPDQYWWVAGGTNYQGGDYAAAIEALSRMRDPSPAFRLLAAAWAMLGDRERARQFVQMTKEIHPDFEVNKWVSILPIHDRLQAEHYAEGLRKAGFD